MKLKFNLNIERDILIRKILAVVVGNFFCALALEYFLKPNNMIASGVLGMSTLISHVTGISMSVFILLINLPMIILGVKYLSKEFMVFSIMSVFLVSFYLEFLNKLTPVGFSMTENILLGAIFGGVLNGVGIGVTLKNGTSTGGLDIIGTYIKKKYNVKIGSALMAINFVIITISGFIFTFDEAMFTLISLFISYQVSDRIQLGVGRQKQVLIISSKYDEITKGIYQKMNRGVTYINGEGAYNRKDLKVIFIICTSVQLVTLKDIVKDVDPAAFMAVSETTEIMGSGFKKIEL
ncbi:MAG: YitT family protein [Peptoniphilus sp.]|nr:YitT family protein [Peptoniphilus sp.]